jgi:transcription factor SFP1
MPMNMNLGKMNRNMGNMNFPYGMGDSLGLDLCIDEPAKRLYNSNGYPQQRQLQQQFAQFGLAQGQYGSNNDMMRLYRQQQQLMAMNGADPQAVAALMMGEEHKPFRCPVIGCEKAYKNQNGLKYVQTTSNEKDKRANLFFFFL